MAWREGSIVRRRWLRAELRRLREQSGRSQRIVADALGWSTSKVIRIETGAVNVATSDVMALLHYYRVNDSKFAEELLRASRARDEGWWDEYRSFYSPQFVNFLGYEDSATRIRQYMGLVVPGLLQTEAYARALVGDYHHDQEEIDRGIAVRMRRQELFDRPHCPELLVVLDEAVAHRWIGGPDVMRRQLCRLKEVAQHPRISIRIVPFAVGMYAGMRGSSFTIFEFPSQDGIVLIEEPHRDELIDDPETSSKYIETFLALQQGACLEGEVGKIIDPVINRMRREASAWVGDQVVRSAPEHPRSVSTRRRRASSKETGSEIGTGPRQNGGNSISNGVVLTEHRVPQPRSPVKPKPGRGPTVGIVTAIPEELVAMHALLDSPVESHATDDPAEYALGTLPSRDEEHPHTVALTRLAATATKAAATGCANMVRSYPSIAVVIMVGIAAGVPNLSRPDLHVRLGDIVVATQIVDYDHVRAVAGAAEVRRPFSLPSLRLTHCADMVRTDELSGHRTWEQWLDLSRPHLARYNRPPEHTDILHDSAGRRLRHPRRDHSGHRKGYPKVHYGRIGSADRSLRDPIVRDELAAQHGVIALEMEGAGIGSSSFLNGREWFVVRGISDYGDSRRSEQWRRYAALVAAAYVRALLVKCVPLRPDEDHQYVALNSLD